MALWVYCFAKASNGGRTVRESMQPCGRDKSSRPDMPSLTSFRLKENHYRLVLRGGRIDGLVTQSDLLKLPVLSLFLP